MDSLFVGIISEKGFSEYAKIKLACQKIEVEIFNKPQTSVLFYAQKFTNLCY